MLREQHIFRKSLCLILILSLILLPVGCKNTSSDAVTYLEQTSEKQLIHLMELAACTQIHPANSCRKGFSSPTDLSSADLYNLFEVNVEQSTLNQYYWEDDEQYHIPVNTVTAFLENYFLDFQFDPVSLISDGRNITLEENDTVLVTSGIVGFSANIADFLTIEKTEILSSDFVSVTAVYQWPEDPSFVYYTLSLQIKNGHPYLNKLTIERQRSSE